MNLHIETPHLSIFHPNARGTGAAIEFEMHPAHGMASGEIYCRIASQASSMGIKGNPVYGKRFDWDNPITASLDFSDICQILQVLRGETESIFDGKGLIHRSAKGTTHIKFSHRLEPVNGYLMEFFHTDSDGTEKMARITFSSAEAIGIGEAFGGAMKEIAFGTSFEPAILAIVKEKEFDDEIETFAREYNARMERMKRSIADMIATGKAVAKGDAIGHLCSRYGKENEELITRMLDIACGDRDDDNGEFTEEYRKLGKDALGEDHPVWEYVVK